MCGSMLEVSRDAAAVGEENSSVVQRSRVNIALSVQKPLTLATIYLSRVGVVGQAVSSRRR
jgi:hypothetical protein